ncbi:putative fic doc family protein [Seiridium cardinale]
MVDDLVKEMGDIDTGAKVVDPFDMASRYCHRFVCIHPFGDGNGRMSRILLNILLIKYARQVSLFGGNEDERNEYLRLSYLADKVFHEEYLDVSEEEKKGHHELMHLVNKHGHAWK